jgi:membrane-associated phospholipid phosphatase
MVAVLSMSAPVTLAGQEHRPAPASGVVHHEAVWLGVAGSVLAVAATRPFDARVRSWILGAPRQNGDVLRGATDLVTPFGADLPFVAGAVFYGYARAFHHPLLADALLHAGEGTVAASVLALAMKVAVHRTRPYVSPHDPGTFFHGPVTLSADHLSFPSGHTTVAFAVAAAGAEELAVHWPAHARLASVGLYGVAAGVAFARVYDDKHWASDVVAGAALGTLVSRAVVRRAHRSGGPDPHGVRPTFAAFPDGRAVMGFRILLP